MPSVTFRNLLNMTLIARQGNTLKIALEVNELLKNPIGSVHGGALYTLADTACGAASIASCGGMVTTINGSIDYLRAAMQVKRLVCEATVIKTGKNVIFTTGEITGDDGVCYASCRFAFHPLGIPSTPIAPDGYRAPDGQPGIPLASVHPEADRKEGNS